MYDDMYSPPPDPDEVEVAEIAYPWRPIGEWLILHPGIDDGAFRLYCILRAAAMDKGKAWYSRALLARIQGVKVGTVDKRLKALVDGKALKIQRRKNKSRPSMNDTNVYVVHDEPAGAIPGMRNLFDLLAQLKAEDQAEAANETAARIDEAVTEAASFAAEARRCADAVAGTSAEAAAEKAAAKAERAAIRAKDAADNGDVGAARAALGHARKGAGEAATAAEAAGVLVEALPANQQVKRG